LGVSQQGEFKNTKKEFSKKSIWAHHKKCGFCFVRFFVFFLPRLFGSILVLSRFWAFRNKGSSKTRLKKIARKSPQLPKKALTHSALVRQKRKTRRARETIPAKACLDA
jgi:hypothetical protein